MAKRFLNLVDRHFPKTNTLHKIFNRNTVKVSYSCTENMENVIKSHNKKAAMSNEKSIAACNCRNKGDCLYKCVVSTKIMPEKVCLGTAQGDFKKRYYNHRKSFKNRLYECDTTLSKYIYLNF